MFLYVFLNIYDSTIHGFRQPPGVLECIPHR